jgi:hypothetical protein
MTNLDVPVRIFDPALPHVTYHIDSPGVDTWHEHVLVLRRTADLIPHIPQEKRGELRLSGGMVMEVPEIDIGIQIGSIRIERIAALVVDRGLHGILLGSSVLERVFSMGQPNESEVRTTNRWKDDPAALAVELYPLRMPLSMLELESFLSAKRRLFNISLIASGEVRLPAGASVGEAVRLDVGIPPELRLKLSWIDSGSIWLTLTSGSGKALKQLAAVFETGADAKLAHKVSEAPQGAAISQATRDLTAAQISEEQDRLRIENIAKAYEVWRNEVRSHIGFLDEMIAKLSDRDQVEALWQERDTAIAEIVEQRLLPIVRNIPRPPAQERGSLLLGPPSP